MARLASQHPRLFLLLLLPMVDGVAVGMGVVAEGDVALAPTSVEEVGVAICSRILALQCGHVSAIDDVFCPQLGHFIIGIARVLVLRGDYSSHNSVRMP